MNKSIESKAVYNDGGWFDDLAQRLKLPGPTAITPEELRDYELEHVSGGIGWMMVQDIDGEYCRIAMTGPGAISSVFLAAKSRLTVAIKVNPETKDRFRSILTPENKTQITRFQSALSDGQIQIKEQRVVDAKRTPAKALCAS